MPISKSRAAKTARGGTKNSEAAAGATWDKKSGPDEYDGRANLQAGDKGKEPGGRWSEAFYESPPAIISKYNVRKLG